MKKAKSLFTLIALSLILSACNIYNYVTVYKDTDAGFEKYRSFAWLPDMADSANSPYNNEVIRNNIRNYFGKSLAERGYFHENNTPDILLQLVITSKTKTREVILLPREYYYSKYYFGSDYYFPYSGNYYYSQGQIYCYPEGYCAERIEFIEASITLHVIDREKNKLIWSCTAKGDVYDPAVIKKSIHPAVINMMKKFPSGKIHPSGKNSAKDYKS